MFAKEIVGSGGFNRARESSGLSPSHAGSGSGSLGFYSEADQPKGGPEVTGVPLVCFF